VFSLWSPLPFCIYCVIYPQVWCGLILSVRLARSKDSSLKMKPAWWIRHGPCLRIQSTPGIRPPFQSAGVPNYGCHNPADTAAAGNTSPVISACSTPVLNPRQETSQAVLVSPISCAAEQEDAPGFQTLWNMVPEYMARPTPISIPLMHRRFTEDQRGLRPPFPPLHSFMALPVLPDVSEGKRVLILFFFLF